MMSGDGIGMGSVKSDYDLCTIIHASKQARKDERSQGIRERQGKGRTICKKWAGGRGSPGQPT